VTSGNVLGSHAVFCAPLQGRDLPARDDVPAAVDEGLEWFAEAARWF